MKLKFKKERYITQIINNNGWSFRVRYKGINKVFNENDYLSSSQAYKEAVKFRNNLFVDKFVPTKITINTCYEQMSEIYVLRSETRRKLDGSYNRYISTKDKDISQVTKADIIADLNNMVNSCSNDTIKRVLSIYRKIFTIAIAKGYIKEDITYLIKPPISHKIKPNKRLELTDIQTLMVLGERLSTSLKNPLECKQAPLILMVLYYTGMRPAELFALDKKDIDFNKKIISITKEMGTDRTEFNIVRTCKTEMSIREVPIHKDLVPFLEDALKDNETDILFPNSKGQRYSSKDLGDKFHKIAKNIGIDFHFYQCRHTFITNLFMKGVDIKTIQEIVGQNIDTTTIGYVVTSKDRKFNAISLL